MNKVELTIEFELDAETLDETGEKPEDILSDIVLVDSDIVDGFELTTDCFNYDRTVVFFIEPSSGVITSRKLVKTENEPLTREKFTELCGGLLSLADPSFESCEYHDSDNGESVIVTCKNGYKYNIDVTANSFKAIAYQIFDAMRHK